MMRRKIAILSMSLFLVSCASQRDSLGPEDAHTDAYQTGVHYLIGRGVAQNYTTARKYFERAAAQNNPYAESELGFMYTAGLGVEQDYPTALQWYSKAANQGLASAQYNLGLMYAHGVGTPVNKIEAQKWFQAAASRGFDPARRALTHN
jgi:TPR repeat protein